jgi:RNA-directed DNA polymerase
MILNKDGWFFKSWLQSPIFHPSSHGFRKGKSTHSALKTIKEWAKNAVWLLDYGIKKAFDNVHKDRLPNIFLKHINQP